MRPTKIAARTRASPLQRGSAMLVVLILSVVAGAVMASLVGYTSHAARMQQRSDVRLETVYAADFALEKAHQQLTALVGRDNVNLPTIAQTTGETNLTTAPTGAFTSAAGYTWLSFLTVPIEDGTVVGAHSSFNPSRGSYRFLTTVELRRSLFGQAPQQVHVQREWIYMLTPLFQYAIFYDRDMELFPGAAFNVAGRVHSNGRIYTGTSASITFRDHVSSVNGLTNNYSPLDPRAPGSPGNNISYDTGGPTVTTREDPPGAFTQDTTDANANNDGPRELIELPDFLQTDPNASDRLYLRAGLKILANSTGSAVAAASGVAVPASSRVFLTRDGTTIPAADPLGTYLATMVATGSMRDYRESATLPTVDVDVSRITAGYSAGGLPQVIPSTSNWPNNASVPAALRNQPIPASLRGKDLWNGILYVGDVSAGPTHRAGIRLLNGTNLPDGSNSASPTAGLTVATMNPIYVVGDYNTGGSPPVNSGSNLAANNFASGYTVQPAAVIADAVTVVSANWISGNYNGVAALNSRNPVNTTVNAAFVSGVVASNGSSYSGGVENFIRLLENWSGRRLTYYGSLINMFPSQQATAPWQNTGNYYNAPARNWYFDLNFRDPRRLPPGTPVARSLKRGQWVQIR